ncbi:hypothetical protein [Burkholderia pseudomultivorans]|uniref:hypothetical protein n=1 Tax=Burkholderia pseudomultivorans TaxID=1207504 RepID=UPI001582EDE6|nr:hypothetical protein [Burkholderia pseudomultivorans]
MKKALPVDRPQRFFRWRRFFPASRHGQAMQGADNRPVCNIIVSKLHRISTITPRDNR